MSKLDKRFLDVLLRDMPYDEAATLQDVLAGISSSGGAPSYGCSLTYTGTRTITVAQGALNIFGAAHVVSADTVISIIDDFGDVGSPLVNTTYYVYAADEDGVLNFYFSASSPTRPGKSDAALTPVHRRVPLQHPAHANWLYIGQVLYRLDATILPFTVCTQDYWEGAFTSATRNVDMTLMHAWGAIPQDIRLMFSTTAANSTNVLTTLAYATPASKLYGALPRTASSKTLDLGIQKDALFWDNNTAAWVNSGYIKLAVLR